ncbi:MAG: AbrB/MazE/SpoVT family DNA-binding domain-containing protein [Firmicutes bacterium]|nr:AbrB/MazE/SpoVT family DNA-binding domain-containing protein [Bacillota bacterium]
MGSEYRTKITSKGQVTIPIEIRRALGLKPGDILEIHESPAGYVLHKHFESSPFDRYVGYLRHKADIGTDALIEEMRGNDDQRVGY